MGRAREWKAGAGGLRWMADTVERERGREGDCAPCWKRERGDEDRRNRWVNEL